MNYGTYRYYKIKFKNNRFFPNVRNYFGIVGVFVKEIVTLNIGFGFCVFNSIWEHKLKIFLDPTNRKISTSPQIEMFPRSVNIFVSKYI